MNTLDKVRMIIVEQLGLGSAKSVATPGVDVPVASAADDEETEEEQALPAEDATKFRTVAARCNYLQPDRPDVQFAVK